MTVRSFLYRAARLAGDANAIAKGRLPQRIARRGIYRYANKGAGRLSRKLGL